VAVGSVDEPTLSDVQYRMFRDWIAERSGLWFTPESRFVLERRLARRVRALDLGSFAAYFLQLRSTATDDGEIGALFDELTTNETYFLRERAQLNALVTDVLPEWVERRRRSGGPVSIWTAGCSSGEEPYSIVMLAREAGFEPGRDFRVYASDLSRRVLQLARRGVYRANAFRETEEGMRAKYFVEKDGAWRIRDDIKRHVVFTRANLMDPKTTGVLGAMDVILCRNVIMYFDTPVRTRVVQSFADKLNPGGYLLLGHAESLIRVSNAFELHHLSGDLVYRKPLPGAEIPDPRHAAARAAIALADDEETAS
jgi:chemotaxis protein methyltransferase CheR